MSVPKFSILITTKDRLSDLQYTLIKIQNLLDRSDVECIMYDDGSIDGTSKYLKKKQSQYHFAEKSIFQRLPLLRK
jgi:glycosyltransferase involved in cell wall biosynthesis